MQPLEMIITSRERDIGGFSVRRLLPYASHRMVGPFIFFDHMGPALFPPGEGMSVRPHPHIGLATVTYLFDGKIRHRDSLGSDQLITPGDINWMTAGQGIVHSERTPEDSLKSGGKMNGIQLWVALPEEHEDTEPSFVHHPAKTLPEFRVGEVSVKLLLGQALGQSSPVKVHSDLFYFEAKIPTGEVFTFPGGKFESAFYVVEGKVETSSGEVLDATSMGIAQQGSELEVRALEEARLMFLGGTPVGERFIFWNFVSSSKEKIEVAKQDWSKGPGNSSRFGKIKNDDQEFIPLPAENKKGTPM